MGFRWSDVQILSPRPINQALTSTPSEIPCLLRQSSDKSIKKRCRTATFVQCPGPGGKRVWQALVRRKGHPQQTQTFDSKAKAQDWAGGIENARRGVFVSNAEAERQRRPWQTRWIGMHPRSPQPKRPPIARLIRPADSGPPHSVHGRSPRFAARTSLMRWPPRKPKAPPSTPSLSRHSFPFVHRGP